MEGFSVLIIILIVYFLPVYLVVSMASRRGRSVFIWVLLSLFWSWLFSVFLLAILGDAPGFDEEGSQE